MTAEDKLRLVAKLPDDQIMITIKTVPDTEFISVYGTQAKALVTVLMPLQTADELEATQ